MTKNTTTNNYRIPADQLQNLEIDRNGRVAPRLHDLEPLKNTLLSVLYPGIKVASVNVPAELLDDYEEAQVENALARLVWNGVHYKLVGASGSAKKGKFYFVDREHSQAIAERFQHWPQAAIVYFGILVSPCRVMMEEPEVRVLVVPDRKLGTNDCRGWIRRTRSRKLPGNVWQKDAFTNSGWPSLIRRRKAHSKPWRMMFRTCWKRTLFCQKARSNRG
jgi:hypothetical protein